MSADTRPLVKVTETSRMPTRPAWFKARIASSTGSRPCSERLPPKGNTQCRRRVLLHQAFRCGP